jgi:MFS family permease
VRHTDRVSSHSGEGSAAVAGEAGPPQTSLVAHPAIAMILICAAQFVLQLDFSIVNVALPTIQRELGMAPAELQWIVTGYALTFGSLLLAGGRLADRLGRRRLLGAGLVLFAVASVVRGLAHWPVMLIIGRVVQGTAGAMVSPAALSLLTTSNPEGPRRNRAWPSGRRRRPAARPPESSPAACSPSISAGGRCSWSTRH